jgi:integrase
VGEKKRLAFGAYPAISLADARLKRDDAKALLAKGIDPGKAKQDEKRNKRASDEHTFARIADLFLAKGEAEGRAPTTQTKNAWLLDKAKVDFGHKAITEISAPMILDCLRKVEARGNYETAQRLRAKISAVFRFAVASGIAEADPAHALRDALIRPTVTPRAAITDPKVRAGFSGDEMTAHGFRASFSTPANESGLWNPDAIEAALAHVERNEV